MEAKPLTQLARRLGFFSLVVYGIGDILGAGIYALVGKVIALAGPNAWLTFVLAAATAILTGLSYAELAARHPVAGGAAAYVRRAFPGRLAATLIGVAVLGTGFASAATVSAAFTGYLQELIAIPDPVAKFLLVSLLSFLSYWGIEESSRINMLFTAVEIFGLLAAIVVGIRIADPDDFLRLIDSARTGFDGTAALAGVTIAFYAYIGFEDLTNLAEEARNPSRDLPRAILFAIAVTTVVYLLVTIVLQVNVPASETIGSRTPLLLIFEKGGATWFLRIFSIIAILAISNTGLINLIMASRLLYGMSNEGLLPRWIGRVHSRRRTPWVGVTIAWVSVLAMVFTGGVKILAQTTGLLILVVFLFVHLSLLRIKWRGDPHHGIRFSPVFPAAGVLMTLILIVQFPPEVYGRTLMVVSIGLALALSLGVGRTARE